MFAFKWTEAAGMQSLSDLPGGAAESVAKGANDRGQIVGTGHIENDYARAVLWDEGGVIRDLGTLRPGEISSGEDINMHGQVVGWSAPYPGGTSLAFVPFLWTEEHGMLDLHTLLDEESAGWRLGGLQMGGINDRGQIMVSGMLDGNYASVLLTPINPEPATLLTCVSGALLLLQRRR
jgi:probable HAF family extracellular repeat protein